MSDRLAAEKHHRYATALDLIGKAGRLALGYFDAGVAVDLKADQSPVTVADRNAEAFLREQIRKVFPGDGLLGEEYGDEAGTSGFRWVIDPIDGTRSFIRNIPMWATLIGVEHEGLGFAGLAYAPAWGQTWHALRGSGAFRDDRPIRVSGASKLSECVLTYSSMKFFKQAGTVANFERLAGGCERARAYGDFYGFVLVAQGSCDLMAEQGVHEWDVAGLRVIIEEAGGRYSNWAGEARHDTPDVLASNGTVHGAALDLLRG